MSSTSLASGAHVQVVEPETTLDDSSSASSDHVRISGGSDRLSALPSSSPQIRAGQGVTMLPSPLLNQNLPLSYSLPGFDIRPLYSRPVALVSDTARDTFRRLSFESERVPISRVIYQGRVAHHRNLRGSDSYMSTPALGTQAQDHQHSPRPDTPNTSHAMPSRSSSPLRIIQQWSATHLSLGRSVGEEPFIPINPFRLRSRLRLFYQRHSISSLSVSNANNNHIDQQNYDNDCSSGFVDHCDCDTSCCFCLSLATTKKACSESCFPRAVRLFILDTLPRQVYLYLLFRLPALYFTRVSRVFRDAEVSRPDIQRLIDTWGSDQSASINVTTATTTTTAPNNNEPTVTTFGAANAANRTDTLLLPYPEEWAPPSVSPALARFKLSWEDFIDSLMTEWKALNVVSALLPTAVVTMLQTPEIAHDPATRTVALMSLICSLTSLCYGCVYLVRFGSMRSMHKATRWAEEARQQRTSIFWNVWVLLAIPGVWLAWSMVLFIATLLLYVYRLDSIAEELIIINEPDASANTVGPRVAITALVCLGILYFVLIISTLKRYGGYASYGREGRRQRMGGVGVGTGAAVGIANVTERVSTVGMHSRDKTAEGNDVSSEKQRSQQQHQTVDFEQKEAVPVTAMVARESSPVGLGLHSPAAT